MAEKDSKKTPIYDEYGYPSENYSSCNEEADIGHEYVPPKEADYVNKKSKAGKKFVKRHGVMIMQTAAVCLAVVVVKDAFGYDVLAHDLFNDHEYEHSTMLAYDEDFVEPEPEPEPEPTKKPKEEVIVEKERKDKPDKSFPTLQNLEPNGYVPDWGVLDEEYVRLEHPDGTIDYIYCTDGVWNLEREWWIDEEGVHFDNGIIITDYYYAPNSDYETEHAKFDGKVNGPWSAWYNGYDYLWVNRVGTEDEDLIEPLRKRMPIGPVGGASYDEATNTLTLENFNMPDAFINVNLMGNGFKIKLAGQNYAKGLLAWGFYYGGSVTFTGDGTLNLYNSGGYGIDLRAEDSQSCIMIEPTVTLDVEGGYGAIIIENSRADKGIYYLEPMIMYDATDIGDTEIVRSFGPFDGLSGDDHEFYSVKDEDNHIVKHLIFTSKEVE